MEQRGSTPGRVDRYPPGRHPLPSEERLRPVECVHCSGPLGVTVWDDWNGFLVVCPHCGGCHGRRWGLERTLLAGLVLNALSFFLTFRPRPATWLFAGYVAAVAAGLVLAIRFEDHDGPLLAAVAVLVLGPLLVNVVALIRHQIDLDRPPPRDLRARRD